MALNTIALELVPPNVDRGAAYAVDEAHKVLQLSKDAGIEGRIRHVMIPGMILLPIVFLGPATSDLTMLKWGIGIVGFMSIAQFSFWGNYLPRVYPTYLRGTGESFAANVGGRMIGTSAALVTTSLVASMPGATPAVRLAYAAALVGSSVYVIGFITSWFLPEPKQEDLPE